MTTIEIMLAVLIAIEFIGIGNNIITNAINRSQGQELLNLQKGVMLSHLKVEEVHKKNEERFQKLAARTRSLEEYLNWSGESLDNAFTRIKALEAKAEVKNDRTT
jgi:hypothetical protein